MFYRDLKPRGTAERLQNIPGKAFVNRVHNNDTFVNVGN